VGFQKLSIPTPWRVIGNLEEEGDLKKPKFSKESTIPNWNFKPEKPLWEGYSEYF